MNNIIEVEYESVDENGNPINPKRKTPSDLETPKLEEPVTRVQVDVIKDSTGKKEFIMPVRTSDGLIPWNDIRLKTPCKLWDFKSPVEEAARLGLLLIKVANKLGGAGLSANQIGTDAKVFALTVIENHHFAVFNPEILEVSEDTILMEEGCLSRPGLWLRINRPVSIKVKYFTFKGEEVRTEYDGYMSRVFQHEYDHMLGIDFTQRVGKLKLDMALKKLDKRIRKAVTTQTMEYETFPRPILRAE